MADDPQQTFYRFDQHFFYVNQKYGSKSQSPYQNELKFALPATIKLMDCVGKHIYYSVKRKEQKKGKKE